MSQFKENLCQAPLVCIDGNVPLSTIQYVCQLAREHQLAGKENLPPQHVCQDTPGTSLLLAGDTHYCLTCQVIQHLFLYSATLLQMDKTFLISLEFSSFCS